MGKIDYTPIIAEHRSEANKAFSRALAFAVILIFAHLLTIKPSEIDASGLKFKVSDPVLIYGAISLVFGYYISKALWHGEFGQTPHPFALQTHRMRAAIKLFRRSYLSEKPNRQKPIDHKKIKSSARKAILIINILLAPYFIAIFLFVIAAIPLSIYDLYRLAVFIEDKHWPF